MITEEVLRRLLDQRAELKNLDYKRGVNWQEASNEDKCSLVKDILAMMNTQDGGQIVFGVKDELFEAVGMENADVESFDPTRVNDFIHKYTDPRASCNVQRLSLDGKQYVVIDVPEFSDQPIICKADSATLKRGALYVRTDKPSSEAVPSGEEMRQLVNRAVLKRGDQLLSAIKSLISGQLMASQSELEKYDDELKEAELFFQEKLTPEVQRAHWEIITRPTNYAKERIPAIGTLQKSVAESEVSFLGWKFPFTKFSNAHNFPNGWESWIEIEAYRAYTSGLFIWRGAYWEDALLDRRGTLIWENTISLLTKIFVFLGRYYGRIAEDASLDITVSLRGTNGRVLRSANIGPIEMFTCSCDVIDRSSTYSVSEIRASPQDAALPYIRRVFDAFQWTYLSDDMIRERQRQLINKDPQR